MWKLQLPPVLLCPCTWGSKLRKLKVREPPPRRVALVSVKTQTEIQTAQVKVQTTPVSVRPQTIKVRETQTIEVEKLRQQKLRVKYLGMRWRTGDKEIKKSRFLQSIPGIVCAERPERLRNSHISCCLFMKHPPGEIISLWDLINPFLIKKYKESRRIWETI